MEDNSVVISALSHFSNTQELARLSGRERGRFVSGMG